MHAVREKCCFSIKKSQFTVKMYNFLRWHSSYESSYLDLRKAAIDGNDVQKVRELLIQISEYALSPDKGFMVVMILFELKNLGKSKKRMSKPFFDFLREFNAELISKLDKYYNVFNGSVRSVKSFLKDYGGTFENLGWNMRLLVTCLFFKKDNLVSRKKMIWSFLQHGLAFVYRQNFGQSMLHRFSQLANIDDDCNALTEIADILVYHGVSIHERDLCQLTPLDYSILRKNISLITILLDKGVDINQVNKNLDTPLHLAVNYGSDNDLIDFILSKGANINAKNVKGDTALHAACVHCREDVIRLLVRRGASVVIKNFCERTPYFKMIEPDYHYGKLRHFLNQFNRCEILMTKEYAKLAFEGKSLCTMEMVMLKAKKSKYLDKCVDELAEMADTSFHSFRSLYSLMKKPMKIEKLAVLTRNEEFAKKFHAMLPRFPYYMDDLQFIWDEAVEFREKFESECTKLYSVFEYFLPDTVVRILAKHLSLQEFKYRGHGDLL